MNSTRPSSASISPDHTPSAALMNPSGTDTNGTRTQETHPAPGRRRAPDRPASRPTPAPALGDGSDLVRPARGPPTCTRPTSSRRAPPRREAGPDPVPTRSGGLCVHIIDSFSCVARRVGARRWIPRHAGAALRVSVRGGERRGRDHVLGSASCCPSTPAEREASKTMRCPSTSRIQSMSTCPGACCQRPGQLLNFPPGQAARSMSGTDSST